VLLRAGRLLLDSGRPAPAAVLLETAQDQLPLDGELLGQIGAARLQAGQVDGAAVAFEAAARLRPRDPRPHYYLGTIALRRGDESAARARFDLALRRQPDFTLPLLSLSRWLADQGRRDEAVTVLRDAVQRNAADPRAAAMLRELGG
jgi:Flp pilus assembly protein TadD